MSMPTRIRSRSLAILGSAVLIGSLAVPRIATAHDYWDDYSVAVKVTNTPTVTFAQGASIRNADNPAFQPFQATGTGTISNSALVTLTTVPANKRLVIEYVSFSASVPTDQRVMGTVSTALASGAASFVVSVAPQGSDGFKDYFAGSQVVRIYADPGTDVVAECDRVPPLGTGAGSCTFAISGYFVDIQ
ncbi:MAG TPA: hypothetical protein VMH32_01655 [Burkholderiales bacterium]|nr:hypothetical protein [Burkholderiales bacterium]